MKTLFTTTLTLFLFLFSNAQKDWAVSLVQPDNFKSASDGSTTFSFKFDLEILEGSVQKEDKYIYRIFILDALSEEVLLAMPSTAFTTGLLQSEMSPSQYMTLGIETKRVNFTTEESRDVIVVVESYLTRNSENDDPIIDTDSTNNISRATCKWLSEADAASVNNISEISIKSYPNPVNDILNIEFPNADGDLEVNVIDMNGRFVLSDKFYSINGTCTIDTKHIEEGTYILQFKQGNTIRNQRITILHH